MEESSQFHVKPLPPPPKGKQCWYWLDTKLGRPQSQPGCREVQKNIAPARIPTPTIQPVASQYRNWAIQIHHFHNYQTKTSSMALVRERTIPTEWPPLVGKVTANLWGQRAWRRQHNGSPWPYSWISRLELLLFLPSTSSIVLTRLSGPVLDPLLLRKSGSAGNRT
jgi:hypothetical protein